MRGAFLFLWRQFHISFSVKDQKRFGGVISVLCCAAEVLHMIKDCLLRRLLFTVHISGVYRSVARNRVLR